MRELAIIIAAAIGLRFLPGMSPYHEKPEINWQSPGAYIGIANGICSVALITLTIAQ